MLIHYINFLIITIVIIIALLHNMIIVIVIVMVRITVAFIVETTIAVILKRKNACLRTRLERLIVMFKVNNTCTKNNINQTALLLALNIRPLPGVEDNLLIG